MNLSVLVFDERVENIAREYNKKYEIITKILNSFPEKYQLGGL